MTLNDYIRATQRLLRDEGTLYPSTDLVAFINEARHMRDLDTRLVRKVVGFTLTAAQPAYSIPLVSANGIFLRGETQAIGKDLTSLVVLPQGGIAGGVGMRYPLGRWPYSKLAYLISTSWPGYPAKYARLGHSTIVLGPPPQQDYASEWDLVGVYPDLTAFDQVDPMADPYNDPLPYLAAAIAKSNAQRFDEGQAFEMQYKARMMAIREGVSPLAIPNPTADLPRGLR